VLLGVGGCSSSELTTVAEPSPTATLPTTVETPLQPKPTTPASTTPFEVTVTSDAIVDANGQVNVAVHTSLPDGAELMIGLFSDAGYRAQDTAFVADGEARFGPFSDDGDQVPVGSYELSISMSLAFLQSAEVRQTIGQRGELMTGPLVTTDEITGENSVSFSAVLNLE